MLQCTSSPSHLFGERCRKSSGDFSPSSVKRAGEVFPQSLLLLYAFSVSLFSTSFTVFDVETTGLAPGAGDRIVEIAGVRIENGKICPEKTFLSLINPQRKISWEAQSVNNIQGEDLEKAPTIDIVLRNSSISHAGRFSSRTMHSLMSGFWRRRKRCAGDITIFRSAFARFALAAKFIRMSMGTNWRMSRPASKFHCPPTPSTALSQTSSSRRRCS